MSPVERRRRFNINDRIKELGTLLPTQNEPFYELVGDGGDSDDGGDSGDGSDDIGDSGDGGGGGDGGDDNNMWCPWLGYTSDVLGWFAD